MENKELIAYVCKELKSGKDVDYLYNINRIPYKVNFFAPREEKGFNIPSIIAIPMKNEMNTQLVVETNNLESKSLEDILEQGIETGIRLAEVTSNKPSPILIPLIPSYKDAPYFQQLSKECFELESDDRNYRIDEQVIRIIKVAKSIVQSETGLEVKDKIFLNGYSSSGVFAQRFALLHPEIVETVCIGGASGSIPLPTKKIGYPIGIADYEVLTGKKFDIEAYTNISFKYYVGELETQNKTDSRFDENGKPASMYDMSYFNRSVPTEVGIKQRNALGIEMFKRAERTVQVLKSLGIDIEHKIILGREHNNENEKGVNELGDKFIKDTYKISIINKKNIENEK